MSNSVFQRKKGKMNLIQKGKDDTKQTKTKVYIKVFKACDEKHVNIYEDSMFRHSFGFLRPTTVSLITMPMT